MGKYHASLVPNHVKVGDTITVNIDKAPKTDPDVVVRVIDMPGRNDPDAREAVVIEASGSVSDGTFSASGAPTPAIPPPAQSDDQTVARLSIVIDGQSVDVGLPRPDRENGLFALKVVILSKGKELFRSGTTALVGFYNRDLPPGRSVVAFLAETPRKVPSGNPVADFFYYASEYWKNHADAVVVAQSLEEIVAYLNANSGTLGPWGEVNIVTHGNRKTVKMNTLQDDPNRMLSRDRLKRIFNGSEPGADRLRASGLDSNARIVFRSCDIGHNEAFLTELQQDAFGGAPTIIGPLFPQEYSGTGINSIETLLDEIEFFVPGHSAPPLTDSRFADAFGEIHETLDWQKEMKAGWKTSDQARRVPDATGKPPYFELEEDEADAEGKSKDELAEDAWTANVDSNSDEVDPNPVSEWTPHLTKIRDRSTQQITLRVYGTGLLVKRRRTMKDDDPDVDYAHRKRTVARLDDSRLYKTVSP